MSDVEPETRDLSFSELIERSSLGTPEAKALRARTSPEAREKIMRGLGFAWDPDEGEWVPICSDEE